MRRAPTRATAVTVASWLVVTALGLSIGAVGLGGVVDLVSGDGSVDIAASGTTALEVPAGTPDPDPPSASTSVADPGGTVVAPQSEPGGSALGGRAPSARSARDGDYRPFRPTSLRLPSGAVAPVQRAGVHPDGALDVPQDPGRVGWWTGGAQAGEPFGTVVLAGHVDSRRYGIGVMAEMLRMRPGQVVRLSAGDSGQRYRVASVEKITKASLARGTDLFDQTGPHRLVMITCGGPFDVRTHRYRDNVVVTAEPVT